MKSERSATGALHPFRARALQRYEERRDRAVLPRFVSPSISGILWLLLALLAAATTVAWFARVPAYVAGVVTVAEPAGEDEQPALVALLPPELLPRLHPGRTVLVHLDSGAHARHEIRAVEAETQSAAAVRRRFALHAETAETVSEPVVVVTLDAASPRSDRSPAYRAGAVYRGEVEAGSCRMLALAPVFGRGCAR